MDNADENRRVRKLLKEFAHLSYVELQLLMSRCLETKAITDESLVKKLLEAKKSGVLPAEEAVIAPVCDTCTESEDLLVFLMGRVCEISSFVGSSEFSSAEKLQHINSIAQACGRRIGKHQLAVRLKQSK